MSSLTTTRRVWRLRPHTTPISASEWELDFQFNQLVLYLRTPNTPSAHRAKLAALSPLAEMCNSSAIWVAGSCKQR